MAQRLKIPTPEEARSAIAERLSQNDHVRAVCDFEQSPTEIGIGYYKGCVTLGATDHSLIVARFTNRWVSTERTYGDSETIPYAQIALMRESTSSRFSRIELELVSRRKRAFTSTFDEAAAFVKTLRDAIDQHSR